MLTIPGPKDNRPSLTDLVNEHFASAKEYSLHPCHRLDRETSGLIIYAKGKRRQQKMMAAFREKKVHKRYIAFVQGVPEKTRGELRRGIRNAAADKYRHQGASKPALTRYRVLSKHKTFSVLEVEPVTGRTNQIRIHLADYGHPVIGERKYAFAKAFPVKFRRVALHAAKLEFDHPVTRERVRLKSGLPDDMKKFLSAHNN